MRESTRRILGQGAVAGVLGYLIVAGIFAVVNLAGGHSPFRTAAELGAALFYGVRDPAQVAVTPEYVFAYNGAHLLVFLVFGFAAAWLASLADRGAQLWYVALFFFLFVGFHLVAGVQALAMPMQQAISGTMVWVAGMVAALAMAGYLVWTHPKLRVAQRWDD
jgi:hypothetical protein